MPAARNPPGCFGYRAAGPPYPRGGPSFETPMALSITHPNLKQITVDVLTAGFAQRDITPSTRLPIIPSAPDEWADLPCVTVLQITDTEAFSHIGDSVGDQYLPEAGDVEVTAGQSALFNQAVEVRLWSKKKDERDRLGTMLLEELFRGRGNSHNPGPYVTTDGLDLPRITGGADEDINDTSREYAPYPIYSRAFTLTALAELTIQESAGEAIASFELRGSSYESPLPSITESAPDL